MAKSVIPVLAKRAVFTLSVSIFICTALSSLPPTASGNDKSPGKEVPAQVAAAPVSQRKISDEIDLLRKEVKEQPTASAFVRLGELLLKEGALNDAAQAFDDALRLNPRSIEARVGKGVVLGRRGEFAQAEQVLRDALHLNPHPARVHYELGLLFEKQEDFGKAIAEYKEGLKKYQERNF